MVYDDSAKRYATWELQSDKTWKPVKTVKMANDKGIVKPVRKEDDTLIAPGTGLWYISEDGAPVIKW